MSEDTWLELVLAFVTTEERQTLRVPARDQLDDLQRALADCDPNNFKRFRQTNCYDSVAPRVIALDKLAHPAPESNKKRPAKLEANALGKKAVADAKPDKSPAPLPLKEEHPDKDIYAKFLEKSLRRRLWDAIVEQRNACDATETI